MAVEAHIAELKRKHSDMERKIEEAIAHPSTDPSELRELKRRKLQLKDEIAKIAGEGQTRH